MSAVDAEQQRAMNAVSEENPGILFVDHVAVAVPAGELERQVAAYEMLGFRPVHREEVYGSDQVREVLLRIGDGPNLIQLLEPLTPESPVQKLIDRNGGRGGLAHVAFRVESAQRAYEHMSANGFQLIDSAPRAGSRGTTVFFVHPKSRAEGPFGVLFEMVEAPLPQRQKPVAPPQRANSGLTGDPGVVGDPEPESK